MSTTIDRTVPTLTVAIFEQIGWEIREVSIDMAAGRAVVRLHRQDGRWLYVAADASGKATIERWQRGRRATGSGGADAPGRTERSAIVATVRGIRP